MFAFEEDQAPTARGESDKPLNVVSTSETSKKVADEKATQVQVTGQCRLPVTIDHVDFPTSLQEANVIELRPVPEPNHVELLAQSAPAASTLQHAMRRSQSPNAVRRAGPGPVADDGKSNTLVLKNIPFSMKLEDLQEFLNKTGPSAPAAVNYHLDPRKQFKGMAFVAYPTIDAAAAAMKAFQGTPLQNRYLKVEYKRKYVGKTKNADGIYSQPTSSAINQQLKSFANNPNSKEMVFPAFYDSKTLALVHQTAEKMGLECRSQGRRSERCVVIKTRHTEQNETKQGQGSSQVYLSSEGSDTAGRITPSMNHRHARDNSGNVLQGNGLSPASNGTSPGVGSETSPSQRRLWKRRNSLAGVAQPIRQPKGPDSTKGFSFPRTVEGAKPFLFNPDAKVFSPSLS